MSAPIADLEKSKPFHGIFALFTAPLRGNSETKGTKKVLVVDDDETVLKVLSTKLNSAGYEVVTAIDASEAISAARDEHPDLILLDISFPPNVAHGGAVAWDGFKIMHWLRTLKETEMTPFIFITADDSKECERRSASIGAVALFHKPINHKELIRAIKERVG
jgi:CheY-like chemotaxis protein